MNIVFCIPGPTFSKTFLRCWTDTVLYCVSNSIRFHLSSHYSCNIYYVRNMCLGGNVIRGKYQLPFNGKLDYDYLMWIDSDIVFTPQQIQTLINHDKDIVSGLYLMEDNANYATCENWDETFFKENGYFKFIDRNRLHELNTLTPVAYTGMGFMLVKKGVFERIEYPWFSPLFKEIGPSVDFTMEDVAFCLKAKEKGYDIYIDPSVIVGHEKRIVLI